MTTSPAWECRERHQWASLPWIGDFQLSCISLSFIPSWHPTIKNTNRPAVWVYILMRKDRRRNRKLNPRRLFSWQGFCANNGVGPFFSNFQLMFFFDELSSSWPLHSPWFSPSGGKQDIFMKSLFLRRARFLLPPAFPFLWLRCQWLPLGLSLCI